MQKRFNTLLAPENRGGNLRPVSGASVTVTDPNGALATIYSDNGVTVAANPLTSNATGEYEYYAADGRYTETIVKAGRDTVTISDILLEDPADSPSPTSADMASTAANKGAGLVGFSALVEYAAGTVGKFLADIASSAGSSLVGNEPAGDVSATTVQGAINELDTEKASLAELAASDGSALVGYGDVTVADAINALDAGTKAAQLHWWRRSLARVRSGTGRVKLALVGDSTTAGWGAAGSGLGLSGSTPKSYPTYLASALNTYFAPAQAQSVWGACIKSDSDTRVTLGTGWISSHDSGVIKSVGGPMAYCPNTATTALSFTPTENVDTFDIYFAYISGGGTFTVNVDGGATLATQNTAASSGFGKVSVTAALGAHTVNIARNGTGGAIYIAGIHGYNSAVPQIDVLNMGWSSSKVGDWAVSGGYAPLSALPIVRPDLTVICLTINDWNTPTPVATYKANMQLLIDAARLYTGIVIGDVVLMTGIPSGPTYSTAEQQELYIQACRELALTNNVPLINLSDRWESYAVSNPNGLYSDQLHAKAVGYADIAAAVAGVVGRP